MNAPPPSSSQLAADWLALIRPDLERVEAQFQREAVSRVEAITEISRYLQQGGGKRLRPALLLLAAGACGGAGSPQAIRLAAIVEMIHSATLIHDDILDGAQTRRGRPATHLKWGSPASVLAGDWLYMQAFHSALRERSFEILDILISLTQQMVEGELKQRQMLGTVVTPEAHRELIERKTACLFAAAARLGALAAGADPARQERLAGFGRHLGMAFQMMDDILDFTASEAVLGKPVGSDLREGKMTLPALYAYARADERDRAAFLAVMRDSAYAGASFDAILASVRRHGGLDRARAESRREAELAAACLPDLPPSPYRSALELLPVLAVEREH